MRRVRRTFTLIPYRSIVRTPMRPAASARHGLLPELRIPDGMPARIPAWVAGGVSLRSSTTGNTPGSPRVGRACRVVETQ